MSASFPRWRRHIPGRTAGLADKEVTLLSPVRREASLFCGAHRPGRGRGRAMFLLFSNRLGCLPSLLLSIAVTVVLLFLFGVL